MKIKTWDSGMQMEYLTDIPVFFIFRFSFQKKVVQGKQITANADNKKWQVVCDPAMLVFLK